MTLVPVASYDPPLTSDTKQVPTYQVYDVTAMKIWRHVKKHEKSRKFQKSLFFANFLHKMCNYLVKWG